MSKDGATLVLSLPARAEDGRPEPRRLLVTDNGGEVNLDWLIDPKIARASDVRAGRPSLHGDRCIENAYFGSVPYKAWSCLVGPLTLASRIWDALAGGSRD